MHNPNLVNSLEQLFSPRKSRNLQSENLQRKIPSIEFFNILKKFMILLETMNSPPKKQSNKGHHTIKHKFTQEEDLFILKMVEENGVSDWNKISKTLKNRTARQCRERWNHYLRPGIVTSPWTNEEDEILSKLYNEIGAKWSIIRSNLPGRTDISIKNRWTLISRKNVKQAKQKLRQDTQPKIESESSCDNVLDICDEKVEFDEFLKHLEETYTSVDTFGSFKYWNLFRHDFLYI